jgi:hypothetical protein
LNLSLKVERKGSSESRSVAIDNLIIAGWTGRDTAALERHIKELEELGVRRPSQTPVYYRVSANLLSTDAEVQMSGTDSSGEVEVVLYKLNDGLFVGLGSDHTDRKVEAYEITVSKQMCVKPVSELVWDFGDVEGHWDALILRAYLVNDGKRELYQEGPVSAMKAPGDLLATYESQYGVAAPGTAMFCGTHAAIGGIRTSQGFEMELFDPILKRSIRHSYRFETLPVNV